MHHLRALVADEGSEPVEYFSLSASFEGIKGLSKTTPSAKSGKTGSMKSASKAEKAQCVGEFVDFGKELPLDAAKKLEKDICNERQLIFKEVLSCVDSYIEAIQRSFIPGNGCDFNCFSVPLHYLVLVLAFFKAWPTLLSMKESCSRGGSLSFLLAFSTPIQLSVNGQENLLLAQGGLKSLNF